MFVILRRKVKGHNWPQKLGLHIWPWLERILAELKRAAAVIIYIVTYAQNGRHFPQEPFSSEKIHVISYIKMH